MTPVPPHRLILRPSSFLLLLLLSAGWYTATLVLEGRQLATGLQTLPALLEDRDRLLREGPAALARNRTGLAELRVRLGPLPQLGRALGWVPYVGPTLAAGEPLLNAADATLQSAEALTAAALPLADRISGSSGFDVSLLRDRQVIDQLRAVQPDLLRAQQAARRAEAAWLQVPPRDRLLPPLAERLARYEAPARLVGPLADSALLVTALADMLEPLSTLPLPTEADAAAWLIAQDSALLSALANAQARRSPVEAAAAQAAQSLSALEPTALPAALQPAVTQLQQLPAAAQALLATLSAADLTLPPLAQLLAAVDSGTDRLPRLVDGLSALRPQLPAAAAAWRAAAAEWRTVTAPGLPARLLTLHDELASTLELLLIVPGMLGSDAERRYLLLALNNDELRPAGGFITSAGVLSINRGRITPPLMEDSGRIRPRPGIAAPYPPQPLREAMRLDQWYFLDAGWSLDFRTSARTAAQLYALSGRAGADDVMALDLDALEVLVEAFGPLTIDGAAQPLRSRDDLRRFIQQQYALSGDNSDELGAIARALIGRFDDPDISLAQLLTVIARLADERHLQIAVTPPDEARQFAARGWDGALQAGGQDLLVLNEANVGYSKSSRRISISAAYIVDLRAPLSPQARLELTRTYAAPRSNVCLPELGGDYLLLASRCQYSYLQLVVPAAATLIDETLPPAYAGWWWGPDLPLNGALRIGDGPAGSRIFAWYSALFPGETQQTVLRYSLPAQVVQPLADGSLRYRLQLQRQAGAAAPQLTVTLQLPPGYRIAASSVPFNGGSTELLLTTNRMLDVVISPAP